MRSARSQRAAATGVLERVIKIQIAAAEALRTLLAVVMHQRCAVANAAYEPSSWLVVCLVSSSGFVGVSTLLGPISAQVCTRKTSVCEKVLAA